MHGGRLPGVNPRQPDRAPGDAHVDARSDARSDAPATDPAGSCADASPAVESPAVIRAADPTDLLALLAVRLGFHPQESLVLASLQAATNRMQFLMRVDLPPPEHVAHHVRRAVSVLVHHGAERVVVVAVGGAGLAHAPLVRQVADALEAQGVETDELLVADGRRWWSLRCEDPDCCDPAGTPYDVSSSPSLAQAVLAGVSVLPSRAALAERFEPVPGPRSDAVAAAVQEVEAAMLARWRRARSDRPLHRTPSVLGHGAARVRRLVRAALAGSAPPELDDRATAELAVWTRLIPVRDVAWSLMSRQSADAHAALWAHVARQAPPGWVAAPLALAGFASWLAGDGAAAWFAVERSREVEPGYSMAELLAEALERAVPPDAWTPVPDHLLDAALDPPQAFDHPAA